MNSIKVSGSLRNLPSVNVGENYFPTLIASIGVSREGQDINLEIQKAKTAIFAGANVIADHSLTDDIEYIHNKMANDIPALISSNAVYEASVKARKSNFKITSENMIRLVESQVQRGMDLLTIHATVFKDDTHLINNSNRVIPGTSRGGMMMLEIMKNIKEENPYWTYFDELLSIAKKYSITYSLGTCYRPASVYDSGENDYLYFMEMERMSKLVSRAQKAGVNIIVEGIGHAPINRIPHIIQKSKEICFNAPYRILTVATDIALGYDHISSAIAASTSVLYGADMITCVSRAEHIGRPSEDDLLEAVISAKIAAHCGYSARRNDFSRDKKMSEARNNIGCLGQIEVAIYKKGAKELFLKNRSNDSEKSCDMCGSFCALDANDRIL